MLQVIKDFPDNVLGVVSEGEITAAEYETILIPAIEQKLKMHKKLRVLYQIMNGFEGFEFAAIIDDAKIGIGHASAWEKIAVVSDHHLVNYITKLFSHFMLCEVRVFKYADLDEAKKWIITEPSETSSWIENAVRNINSDFPLSGGETDIDLEQAVE